MRTNKYGRDDVLILYLFDRIDGIVDFVSRDVIDEEFGRAQPRQQGYWPWGVLLKRNVF